MQFCLVKLATNKAHSSDSVRKRNGALLFAVVYRVRKAIKLADKIAVAIVIPALGPSFLVAPSGK